MDTPALDRLWRAHPDVAWVDGDGRAVLMDLRSPASSEPMVCPEPAASLWREIAEGPATEQRLCELAERQVGKEQAHGLVRAFVGTFSEQGLIEEST